MTRHLFVDGYNLLGVQHRGFSAGSFMSEAARERLIHELALYHQRKGHAVTVVFDGWQSGGGTEHREFRQGVAVVYSKRGERADQVIQRLAEEWGPLCAVVSSDREVAEQARRSGAFVMGAQEFAGRLGPASPGGEPVSWKKAEDEDPQAHRAPDRRPDKKGNPRKLPKSVRMRQRKLKKF